MKKEFLFLDKNGNVMYYFRGLWWSRNFDRFWQLLLVRNAPPVLTCMWKPKSEPRFLTLKDGRPSRMYWYKRWLKTKLVYIDPDSQSVYPTERFIDRRMENPYAK